MNITMEQLKIEALKLSKQVLISSTLTEDIRDRAFKLFNLLMVDSPCSILLLKHDISIDPATFDGVQDFISNEQKIKAIKLLRDFDKDNIGLRDAKNAVEDEDIWTQPEAE
jgi:hypothetical protein